MKKNMIVLLISFLFIFICELVFSIFTYNNFNIYVFLYSILYSLIIYILYNVFKSKLIVYFSYIILFIVFISNYIYFVNYGSFLTLNLILSNTNVFLFSNNIFTIIFDNIWVILLFILVFGLSIYFIYRINVKKYNYVYPLISFIVNYILILILILFNNNGIYSVNSLYFDINFPIKNLYSFGLINSIRLDTQRTLFGFNERGYSVKSNDYVYDSDLYNVLDTKFVDGDNEKINEINNYLMNNTPTLKNMYTGMFENKNLIFILAESFNTIAIDENITPSLYKLYSEGFTFSNFYNPLYPVSTADGQYLADTSLYPADSVMSLTNVNDNYIPYSLGNMFKSNGYKTYAYHNYKYDYYERDKYYNNMGYDIYKAIGNSNINSKSDYDMVKNTIDEYINEDKFLTYYLTMSGHAPYNKSNELVFKNIDKLDLYNYSDNVKYYLSLNIELDLMIEHIFKTLEEKDLIDDTVIVLIPDHVPYGLSEEEMNEISDVDRFDEFNKYKSEFIIYNPSINKYKSNDNYSFNIDVLPTLLNLYGFKYDSRLLMGKDILSNNDGLIVFGNRNIIKKEFMYSNQGEYIRGNYDINNIPKLKEEIYMKFRISRLMLEEDYYRFLFK